MTISTPVLDFPPPQAVIYSTRPRANQACSPLLQTTKSASSLRRALVGGPQRVESGEPEQKKGWWKWQGELTYSVGLLRLQSAQTRRLLSPLPVLGVPLGTKAVRRSLFETKTRGKQRRTPVTSWPCATPGRQPQLPAAHNATPDAHWRDEHLPAGSVRRRCATRSNMGECVVLPRPAAWSREASRRKQFPSDGE